MTGENTLTALTSIDGRYRSKLEDLSSICSEMGLIKYRVLVELRWLRFLSLSDEIPDLPGFSEKALNQLEEIESQFSLDDAKEVKRLERQTNHDVKAVEYFIKNKISDIPELKEFQEWIHFGCTSEDINNCAYGLMVKSALAKTLLPIVDQLLGSMSELSIRTKSIPMLSRTHGQTASPTTLGKEIANTIFRLKRQKQHLSETQVYGKFNGAVGNFNAHVIAYPEADWPKLSENFIQSLGLINNPMTTQIEPHDYLAEIFHTLIRTNQIILDFNRDMWSYISIDYFKQRNVTGEVGSSTMPHKINPIDFENSEGNIGIGNSILEHMASKLLVSRWQRDLTDSTVLRNIGAAFAYCSLAYQATIRGISRVAVNEEKIAKDLDESWEVLAEAVQTIMRKYNLAEPYEKLKLATRGKKITRDTYVEVLMALELPKEAMEQLENLTPQEYIGLADSLAELAQQ